MTWGLVGVQNKKNSRLYSGTMQAISEMISQYITKDKEGHLKIQNPIHREYRRKLNMHAPNIRASKYMNQEVKGKQTSP